MAETPTSTCTLYQGDCLDVMPQMQARSVNMIFADLPFGATKCAWDCPIDLSLFWNKTKTLSAKSAATVLCAIQPFGSSLIQSNPVQFKYQLIWAKRFAANFATAKYRPMATHEELLVFAEGRTVYNAQMTERDKPIVSGGNRLRAKSARDIVPRINYEKKTYRMKHPGSILEFSCRSDKRGLHPTQKPVALLEWLIKTYTNESDTVLDPVMGSATTAIACARLGRHFIGIEKDAEYFRIGRERVDAEREKLGLQPCKVNP